MREYDVSNLEEEIVHAMLDLFVLSKVFNINLPKALDREIDEMARGR
jgi:NTP pyrophosphatase (non-canonical NTP hydrolase)